MTLQWVHDLDALQFPAPNGGICFIHRRAFRAVFGREPQPADCLAFVRQHAVEIEDAATERLAELTIGYGKNYHLNSRHIRRTTIWRAACMSKVSHSPMERSEPCG